MDRPRDRGIEGDPDHDTPGGRDPAPVENRPDDDTTAPEADPASEREVSRPDPTP